jgi:hypothetical protein
MPIFDQVSRQQLGQMKISVSEGTFRGNSCYFISMSKEVKWSENNFFASTLTAYVGPMLETWTESLYDVNVSSEIEEEHIVEAILEENGRLVVTESWTEKDDVHVEFPSKSLFGLIMKGIVISSLFSNLILARIN